MTRATSLRFLPSSGIDLPLEGALPSFRAAAEWLNSQALGTADLGDEVVLSSISGPISCINWRRSLRLQAEVTSEGLFDVPLLGARMARQIDSEGG